MSKRSHDFKRRARDKYDTPLEAVLPLLPHLKLPLGFCEPCAGKGSLVDALVAYGALRCSAYDRWPRRDDIIKKDARTLGILDLNNADYIITNTPWSKEMLWLMHELIVRFSDLRPTWMLTYADWMHTLHYVRFKPRVRRIVSVGRVRWIEGSKSNGYDNMCWYLFDKPSLREPVFIGRLPRAALDRIREALNIPA